MRKGNELTRQKHRHALKLRLKGMSMIDIADQLGYKNSNGAYQAISSELGRLNGEDRKRIIKLELLRLDQLQESVWELAISGNSKAIRDVLKIMERRSSMLGLDAPKKFIPTDEVGEPITFIQIPSRGELPPKHIQLITEEPNEMQNETPPGVQR